MERETLARLIFERSNLKGRFLLRSGMVSDEYFDKYLFESDPRLLLAIAEAMRPLIPPATEVLAGLEMGGIPLATILSQVSGLPLSFVRKKAKTYGTCKLAEGAGVAGRTVTVVEDVVTSGGQIVESAEALRGLGARITDCVCVIDREASAEGNLSACGIVLRPLFTMNELKGAACGRHL